MPYEPPQWIKLDHSANIYPATLSRRLAAMFRLSVTLNEAVDPVCLQKALEQTIQRIRSYLCFRYMVLSCDSTNDVRRIAEDNGFAHMSACT